MRQVNLVIIGAGPAGLSAAVAAYDTGERDILVLERADAVGGILCQCIHAGFGLHRFSEELTGVEYAARYEDMAAARNIETLTGAMVVDISPDKIITATNERGVFQAQAKAIILAMGCRERPRGALNIAGTRAAGVYTAGLAQKFVNIYGVMPGKNVVILGSGDIGLIMARRLTLEGASVKAVVELMPYSGGLTRNIVQCLNDFNIPLLLSHTVTRIFGEKRVSGVEIAAVDERRKVILGTEQVLECDTLLLSVGLLPENELSKMAGVELSAVTGGAIVDQNRQTSVDGIFACGNALHVHDLVDFVSEEAALAGERAAEYIAQKAESERSVNVLGGERVRYVVPQKLSFPISRDVKIYFRVTEVAKNMKIVVSSGDKILLEKKRNHIAPGEMETLILAKGKLENCDRLTVAVVPDKA